MKNTFRSMFGSSKAELAAKAKREDDQLKKVNESYKAFLEAATGTIGLAEDLTSSLRDRIDDYTNQIEATSQVIPDALILIGSDGKLENANKAAGQMFGLPRSKLLGKTLQDLFRSVDNGEVSIAKFKKLFAGVSNSFELVRRGNLEIKGLRSDGIEFYPNIKVSDFTRADSSVKHILLVQDITENIEAEQRFIEVFDQQSATLKALPDILITIDDTFRIVRVINSGVYDSFITEDDTNKLLNAVLSPENFALFVDKCLILSQSNHLETWSFQVVNDNGSTTYFEARATKCGDEILIMMRDESDVVVTREELLESEQHFRMFGQASSEAMMLHNDTKILDWNPRLGEMTGFSSLEISQMSPRDFLHPMERAKFVSSEPCNKAYTTLFYTKTGDSLEVAINERQVEWKGELARIKVIRDITHLKDVEQILYLSRERYKSLTDNTFDVMCCYGSDLKLTFVNQTFMDYFAKQIDPDTSLLEAIDARDHIRVQAHLAEITSFNPVKRTVHRVRYQGETRWLDWIDRAVFDEQGNFLEYQGIGRDVTDYIKRAKELMH